MAQPDQSAPHTNPLLAAALDYAARGWPVFPLQPDSKVPFGGTHGHLDATTDERQIRAWWRRWPHANIGYRPQGVVIDEDTYKGADAGVWLLPITLMARSARGGTHRYFAYPDPLPCVAEGKLAPGICVKTSDGYVVLPPSRFKGKAYSWVDRDQPVAQLPERIAAMIRAAREEPAPAPTPATPTRQAPASTREDSAQYWLDWAMAQTGDGSGDHVGYLLAQQLLANGVPDVEGTLSAYARQATLNPHEPFTGRDVARWLKSARDSKIVRRGEPALSRTPKVTPIRKPAAKPAPARTEPPMTDGTAALKPPEITDEVLLKGEADDNGNAEAMYRLYGREFLYAPAYGWLRWVGTHWQAVPEPIVQQCAIITLKKRRHAAVEAEREQIVKATKCQKERVNGCYTLFKSYVIEPDVAAFDADPDLLNCRNGVLDLRTRQLTPHDSKQRFTYCVPVDYDTRADSSAWRRWLLEALGGDEQMAEFIQLCAGYSLTGHTRQEKMFYLYGPPRSGKGTFTETLLALLPHPLATEVDFSSFTAQRDNDSQNFDLAGLKPARVVFASESNRHQSLNPAKIKSLTGGNLVRCAFKNKDMFTYRPQFKVWLVSNHEVNGDPDDDALWGRVHVFTFPISHLGKEDVTLKEGMKAPANLPGVLAWAVDGAIAWREQGCLKEPESIRAATQAHRAVQDFTAQWVADCCQLDDPEHWVPYTALRLSYTDWCERNGIKPLRSNDLVDSLVKRFGCVAKRQAGTGTRGYTGIQLGVTP